MGSVKKLASQTLVYGMSSMLGRFINFLLVPLYTACYNPHEYGIVTDIYALLSFMNILLVYGMETSFFNFVRERSVKDVFATGFNNLLISTGVFLAVGSLIYPVLAGWTGYELHPEYILWCVWILGLDALSALPFALLRQREKALRFSFIRLVGILTNVLLNLYFLLWAPRLVESGISAPFYNASIGLGYIFISNLISSLVAVLLLLPECFRYGLKADPGLRKDMLNYAWPLVFIGLAGMANETFDRAVLKYLTPGDDKQFELGVYGAFYKLSMIMTMFVQAFRLAAEPFFFSQHKNEDSKLLYARIMDYFVMVCGAIFLFTMLFSEELAGLLIRSKGYFTHPDGMKVVPILLLANWFLGIFYSISVWYRLTNNTKKGSRLSVIAAFLTVALNLIFIPLYGFLASAWATLIVYVFLAVANYVWGQRYYKVPYNLPKLALIMLWSVGLYFLTALVKPDSGMNSLVINGLVIILFAGGLLLIERTMKTSYGQ